MLAVVLCELGEDAEGPVQQLALNDFRDLPRDYVVECLESRRSFARTLVRSRCATYHLTSYSFLYADLWVSFIDISLPFGLAHRQLALLSATYGDDERAVHHFDAALDLDWDDWLSLRDRQVPLRVREVAANAQRRQ